MKRTFVLVVMVLFVFTAGYSQTATTTTVQSDMFVNNTSGSSASFDEDNPSTELGTDEHSFAFGDTPDGSVPGTTDGEWAEEAAPTWTVTTPSGNEVDVPNESINKDTNSATMGEPNLEVAEEVAGDWEVEEKPTGFEEEDEEIETVKEETPKEPEAPLPPHCPREPGEYTIHNGVAIRTKDTETEVADPDNPGETVTVTENVEVEAAGGVSYYVDDVTAPLVDVGIYQDQGGMKEDVADKDADVKNRARVYSVKMKENPRNSTRDKKTAGVEVSTSSLIQK